MPEPFNSQERTPAQEAEYRLACTLDLFWATFRYVQQGWKIINTANYSAILFISEKLKEQIRFYCERASLHSKASRLGYQILHHRRFFHALAVFQSDFPRASVWNFFDDYLAGYVFKPFTQFLPVNNALFSHGQNFTDVCIADSRKALNDIIPTHTHYCDYAGYESLIHASEITQSEKEAYGMTAIMKSVPGRLITCEKCGTEILFDIIPVRKLEKMYAKYHI